jgi:alpha-beta hydrolase superfamily lysophospholipase
LPLGCLLALRVNKKPKIRAAIITAPMISPILLLGASAFPFTCLYFSLAISTYETLPFAGI